MRTLALLVVLLAATSGRADPKPIAWQWDAVTPDLFPRVDLAATGGAVTYRLALAHDKLQLSNGTWSAVIQARDGDETGVAMTVDGPRVYLATYNRISSGCELAAYAIADGKQLWTVSLTGVGPIGHSKYHNRVQLRVIDGKPVVFGSESAKRYIEVREPDSGKLVSNTQLDAVSSERPLSEALYRELEQTLATRATYEVSVNDFWKRLAMKDIDHTARGAAIKDAVNALQGMPIQHGRYKLELSVVETSSDFTIKAKRRS